MAINIENIQASHKKGIRSLLEIINQEDKLGYSLTDEWLDYIIQHTSESVFVAIHNGSLVGIATCMINEMDHTHGVINIVVHPHHRNKGVGTQLHKRVTAYAKEKKIQILEAYIKERLHISVKFAKNRGFTTVLHAWEMTKEVKKTNEDVIRQDNIELIFRQATIKDNTLYADIINHVFGDSLGSSVLGELLKDPSVKVYILEKEGQAIGSITIQFKANLSVGYIYDVAIIEQYRGKELGSYMLNKSIEELQKHHIAIATLTVTGQNKKALSLYKRLGFEEKDVDILGTVPI